MVHPRMYHDDDPFLGELREICLGFPESSEVEAWGRPTFRAGTKMFAVFGDTIHADRLDLDPSDRSAVPYSVIFKTDPNEHPALAADERFYDPPYFRGGAWIGLRFTHSPVDWVEVAELMETSYRTVALKRMLRALDTTDT